MSTHFNYYIHTQQSIHEALGSKGASISDPGSTLFKQMILLHKYSAIISKGKCLTWLQDFLLADNNSDTHNMKNGDIGIRKIL